MLKINDFVLNQVPHVVVPYINVLGSQMLNWIFQDTDNVKVVTIECYDFSRDSIFFKHISHPNELCASTTSFYIFKLYCGK